MAESRWFGSEAVLSSGNLKHVKRPPQQRDLANEVRGASRFRLLFCPACMHGRVFRCAHRKDE
jgi:hypothetical protein